MFGNKYSAIFRSRWRAVIWASGVLLTAYCTVPREDGGDPVLEAATAVAASAGETHEGGTAEEEHHANPWALDPAKRQ